MMYDYTANHRVVLRWHPHPRKASNVISTLLDAPWYGIRRVRQLSARARDVALTCALAGTLATPAAAQTPARLQPLVNDAVAQLQLSFRHHRAEQLQRYEELREVVEAWQASPRTDANNRLLEDWLRAAIRSSMPGARTALPPRPQFDAVDLNAAVSPVPPSATKDMAPADPADPPSVATTIAQEEATELSGIIQSVEAAPADADPFADDPIIDQ